MSCVIPLFLFSDKTHGIQPITSFPASQQHSLEFCFAQTSTNRVFCTSKGSMGLTGQSNLMFKTQLKELGDTWNLSVFDSEETTQYFYKLLNCAPWEPYTARSSFRGSLFVPSIWGMELSDSVSDLACGDYVFRTASGATIRNESFVRIHMTTKWVDGYIECKSDMKGNLVLDCTATNSDTFKGELYLITKLSGDVYFLLSIHRIVCQVAFKAMTVNFAAYEGTISIEDVRLTDTWRRLKLSLSNGTLVESSLSMSTVASSSASKAHGESHHPMSFSLHQPRHHQSASSGNPELPPTNNSAALFRPCDQPSTLRSSGSTHPSESRTPSSQKEVPEQRTGKGKTRANARKRTDDELDLIPKNYLPINDSIAAAEHRISEKTIRKEIAAERRQIEQQGKRESIERKEAEEKLAAAKYYERMETERLAKKELRQITETEKQRCRDVRKNRIAANKAARNKRLKARKLEKEELEVAELVSAFEADTNKQHKSHKKRKHTNNEEAVGS